MMVQGLAKKGVIVLFMFVLLASAVLAFSGSGSGTSGDPYQITSCDLLNEIRLDYTAYYRLDNNIDCDVNPYNIGSGFTPIGNSGGTCFSGQLNGQGYNITGFYTNQTIDQVGLFGCINAGATIANFSMIDVNVKGSGQIAPVVGIALSCSPLCVLDNIHVSGGMVNATSSYGGGIVGEAIGVTVADVSNDIDVHIGSVCAGGIIGYLEGAGSSIVDSYSTGDIYASSRSGGFIGCTSFDSAIINRSYSTGNVNLVSGACRDGGGFIGNINGPQVIENCYATGDVYVNDACSGSNIWFFGGFVGLEAASDYTETVRNCYATGNVHGDSDSSRIGGFVGQSGYSNKWYNLYSTGNVTGGDGSYKNGFMGRNLGSFTYTNIYWNDVPGGPTNCDSSGNPSGCNKITGNEAYFYDATNAPMSSWDFTNSWFSRELGDGFPGLRFFGIDTQQEVNTDILDNSVNDVYVTEDGISVCTNSGLTYIDLFYGEGYDDSSGSCTATTITSNNEIVYSMNDSLVRKNSIPTSNFVYDNLTSLSNIHDVVASEDDIFVGNDSGVQIVNSTSFSVYKSYTNTTLKGGENNVTALAIDNNTLYVGTNSGGNDLGAISVINTSTDTFVRGWSSGDLIGVLSWDIISLDIGSILFGTENGSYSYDILNEAPIWDFYLPNVTFFEDGYNDSINLSDYSSDAENNIVGWSCEVNSANITLSVNNETGILNISSDAEWSGSGFSNCTVVDGEGEWNVSNNFNITVTSVNDAPIIDIDNKTINRNINNSITINLSDYTTDPDNVVPDNMTWYVQGVEDSSKVDCKLDGYLYVDNTNADVIVNNFLAGERNSTNFTIEFWMKPRDVTNGIVVQTGSGQFFTLDFAGTDGSLRCGYGGDPLLQSSASFTTSDDWRHIAFVFNGTHEVLYVDSVEDTVHTMTSTFYLDWGASGTSFSIGDRYGDHAYDWKGYIDEFRMYNRSLSASEVNNSYQRGLNNLSSNNSDEQLVGYWPFDQDASDLSVNGNEGILRGNAYIENNEILNIVSVDNFNGVSSCTINVTDGELWDTSTFWTKVIGINDPPVLNISNQTTPEDTNLTIYLSSYTTDSDDTVPDDMTWYVNGVGNESQVNCSMGGNAETFSIADNWTESGFTANCYVASVYGSGMGNDGNFSTAVCSYQSSSTTEIFLRYNWTDSMSDGAFMQYKYYFGSDASIEHGYTKFKCWNYSKNSYSVFYDQTVPSSNYFMYSGNESIPNDCINTDNPIKIIINEWIEGNDEHPTFEYYDTALHTLNYSGLQIIPAPNFVGINNCTINVTDGTDWDNSTFWINVTAVNDGPILNITNQTTDEDVSFLLNLSFYTNDPDNVVPDDMTWYVQGVGNDSQVNCSISGDAGWLDLNESRVTIPYDLSMVPEGEDFAIEMWAYWNSTADSNGYTHIYSSRYPASANEGIIIAAFANGGSIWSLLASSDCNNWDIAGHTQIGSMVAGEWAHLVVTRIGNTIYLYKNGVLGNTIDVTGKSICDDTDDIGLGDDINGQYGPPPGTKIDEFRFYKGRGLTSAEVNNSYERGLLGLASNNSDTNLTAYLSFDVDASDDSGNGNGGTLVGGAFINQTSEAIGGANNELLIIPYPDWNGVSSCTINVTDGELWDSSTFWTNVTPVNDAPIMSIPNQTTQEEVPISLNLSDYTIDIDNVVPDDMTWYVQDVGNSSQVNCNIDSNNLTITPTTDFFGISNCTINVTDGDLWDSSTFSINVTGINDAPILNISNQTTLEDTNLTINLSDYTTDSDNIVPDDMTWYVQSVENESQVNCSINGDSGLLVLDGDGDYVDYGDNNDYSSADKTYEIWINFKNFQQVALIFGKADEYWISYNFTGACGSNGANKFNIAFRPSGWFCANSVTEPVINTWYHVVLRYNSSNNNADIFVNGVKEGTSTNSFSKNTANHLVNNYVWTDHEFNGFIDEVRMYDKILSDAEINTTYQRGINNLKANTSDQGLIAYWSFDDNASDDSGNGHDGTLGGDAFINQTSEAIGGANNELLIIPYPDWYGMANCTINVTDGADWDNSTFWINVTPVNDPPVLDIPSQIMIEDINRTIDLRNYTTDIDNVIPDDMNWSVYYENASKVHCSIQSHYLNVLIPYHDWNGTTQCGVNVTDNSAIPNSSYVGWDESMFFIDVGGVNDIPIMNKTVNFTTPEDTPILNIDLWNYTYDPDGPTVTWTVVDENTSQVDCEIDNNLINMTPALNWYGLANCTINVTDTFGGNGSVFWINVTPVNDLPEFTFPNWTNLDQSDDLINIYLPSYTDPYPDPEGDTVSWTVIDQTNNSNIACVISGDSMNVTTNDYFTGLENCTIRISDTIDQQDYVLSFNVSDDDCLPNIDGWHINGYCYKGNVIVEPYPDTIITINETGTLELSGTTLLFKNEKNNTGTFNVYGNLTAYNNFLFNGTYGLNYGGGESLVFKSGSNVSLQDGTFMGMGWRYDWASYSHGLHFLEPPRLFDNITLEDSIYGVFVESNGGNYSRITSNDIYTQWSGFTFQDAENNTLSDSTFTSQGVYVGANTNGNIIKNSRFENMTETYDGITLSSNPTVLGTKIYNNTFKNIVDIAIDMGGSNVNVSNNYFEYIDNICIDTNGDNNIYENNVFNLSDIGIRIYTSAGNITVRNNQFIELGMKGIDSLVITGEDNYFYDNYFEDVPFCYYITGASTKNFYVYRDVLNNCYTNDVFINGPNVHFTDVDFDQDNTNINSNLYVYWTIDLETRRFYPPNPLEAGVTVNYTYSNGTVAFHETSDGSGYLYDKVVMEYFENGTGKNYMTPHNAYTNKTDPDLVNWNNYLNVTINGTYIAYIKDAAMPYFTVYDNLSVNYRNVLNYTFVCEDPENRTMEYFDNTTLFDINNNTGNVVDDPAFSEANQTHPVKITCSNGDKNASVDIIYNITIMGPQWDCLENKSITEDDPIPGVYTLTKLWKKIFDW